MSFLLARLHLVGDEKDKGNLSPSLDLNRLRSNCSDNRRGPVLFPKPSLLDINDDKHEATIR